MSLRRMYLLAALALPAGALSCEENEAAASTGQQLCEDVATFLRGCGLLSEGEPSCGLFQSGPYAECVRPCVEVASCEDFRAQACDGVSNDLGLCIDRCLYEAASFDCGDGTRVDPDDRCDDVPDCADGSDEQRCDELVDTYECGDGERVAPSDRCDGDEDCTNGRDEEGCPMRAMTLCPGGF